MKLTKARLQRVQAFANEMRLMCVDRRNLRRNIDAEMEVVWHWAGNVRRRVLHLFDERKL